MANTAARARREAKRQARVESIRRHLKRYGEYCNRLRGHAAPETVTSGPYDEMTLEQLRAELVERDLPKSGNKPELVARLEQDDQNN